MSLHNITKTYTINDKMAVQALTDICITIKHNEWVAIMGSSGSGKTTLLNILGGLDHPTSGEYICDTQRLSYMTDSDLCHIRQTKIGCVFQQFHLISHYTALQNVALPLIYTGVSHKKAIAQAKSVLLKVSLHTHEHHYPHQLSGGQQQRIAIARALILNPPIIIADEPTGNLDTQNATQIMKLFQWIHSQGTTIVWVTHDASLAQHAKRILSLQDGKIIGDTQK